MKSCSAAPMNLVGVDEATRGTCARQGRQGVPTFSHAWYYCQGSLGRPRMVLYLKGGQAVRRGMWPRVVLDIQRGARCATFSHAWHERAERAACSHAWH